MKKFWGYVSNGEFSVGCTGGTVYVYDKDNNEVCKHKDITYGYTPMISPNGSLFVVKSTVGRLAVYSLKTLSLIKKFRFSKVDGAQDDGGCFSPDGSLFFNIERQRQGDSLHTAVSVYDTSDFSLIKRIYQDENIVISHIEFDLQTNTYYVLGFTRGDEGVINQGFVAKLEDYEIKSMVGMPVKDYRFYRSYKDLEIMGFTEKKYEWSYMDCSLEELRSKKYTLAEVYSKYKNRETAE